MTHTPPTARAEILAAQAYAIDILVSWGAPIAEEPAPGPASSLTSPTVVVRVAISHAERAHAA